MTVFTCEFPGCGEELKYAGRGRPPKRCDEHKGAKIEGNSDKSGEKMPAPRPRPGQKSETKAEAQTPRPRPGASLPSVGKPDTGSRPKAENAARRANMQVIEPEDHPRGSNGTPMAKIVMAASELIPTGQYANVSVGPAQIHLFIDLDRSVNGESYLSEQERATLTKALNELAEVIERDVIAVQRNLVLESMQDQLSEKK